jgi:hypothetical protein
LGDHAADNATRHRAQRLAAPDRAYFQLPNTGTDACADCGHRNRTPVETFIGAGYLIRNFYIRKV